MIGRPELVFLDEPTAGLDPQARHATWELIEGLRAGGAAVILATHYMEEAERLADQVVIVDHGQVVVSGPPAELTGSDGQLRFRAEPGLDLAACWQPCRPGPWPRSHRPGTTWSRCPSGSTRSSSPR